MGVTNVERDVDALTLTVTAEFAAAQDKVWELLADPRKLEKWWGPPSHPATVIEHDLSAGGEVFYYMTSTDGEKFHGRWRFTRVDAPKGLEFIDSFADADGNGVPGVPSSTVSMELTATDGGTRLEVRSVFDTAEQMEQLLGMGMAEGLEQSVNQIDALLISGT
jgi:uncharacterized protein YndB with AHSA1/START domain